MLEGGIITSIGLFEMCKYTNNWYKDQKTKTKEKKDITGAEERLGSP